MLLRTGPTERARGLDDFRDKTAVITGGASGIGLAVARRLGEEGANVVLADVEEEALDRARTELDNAGIPVEAVVTDVTDRARITALADAAESRAGTHREHRIDGRHERRADDGSVLRHQIRVVDLSESLWHEAQMTDSNVGVSVLCPAFVRTGIARSDRNQPDGMGGWVTAGSQMAAQSAEFLSAGVDGGIEPTAAADAVVDGIRAGRLWIFTHPDSPQRVLDRAQAIFDGGVPGSASDHRLDPG